MRILGLVLVASLSGCSISSDEPSGDEAPPQVAVAAFSFDGADTSGKAAIEAHGKRLSHVLGCRGCHTPTLEGENFGTFEPPFDGIYASNLTRIIPTMTDAQLERLLRDGTHPTRDKMWIMPSSVFQRLSSADMAALIAHLRTIKPSGKATPPPAFTDTTRGMIAAGKLRPESEVVKQFRASEPVDLGPQYAFGRYVASATCAECHGAALEGVEGLGPDLNVASVYSEDALARLLTTGEGLPGRKLGLMALVGKEHFSYLTPRERTAVIAYVKARADRSQ